MSEWKGKGFSYFCNTNCEYFPCHQTDKSDFNCLFCYCPLYEYKDCGGNFTYLENAIKDCSACILPHRKENYGLIIERLQKQRSSFSKENSDSVEIKQGK
ncbi:MAG: cysteine-rich small domain-containing protein [Lachnospiraceae bacterium]|nr:cysteine-rich small domain-containing protein [Lachnospiraceae bacterium]